MTINRIKLEEGMIIDSKIIAHVKQIENFLIQLQQENKTLNTAIVRKDKIIKFKNKVIREYECQIRKE